MKGVVFFYDYFEHHEEHALIIEGRATIIPKNVGILAENINVSEGDYLIFKKGFQCEWQIHQKIRKRYCFFDEKGEIVIGEERIACDVCGKDCTDESAAVTKTNDNSGNVNDLCLPCFRLYRIYYSTNGEHLVKGVNVGGLETISLIDQKRKRDDY